MTHPTTRCIILLPDFQNKYGWKRWHQWFTFAHKLVPLTFVPMCLSRQNPHLSTKIRKWLPAYKPRILVGQRHGPRRRRYHCGSRAAWSRARRCRPLQTHRVRRPNLHVQKWHVNVNENRYTITNLDSIIDIRFQVNILYSEMWTVL
jgi:hypothetical protein